MSQECTHNCSSCNKDCGERDLHEKPHPQSSIKKVIAVVSGKGGVGKSIVTSMLSVLSARKNHRTAILDADITGPSIPKAFGIHEKAVGDENGLLPAKSKTDIQIMSLNMLLPNESDPVIWRGPVIAGAVKQFWTDVIWQDVDTMFIDMPPGTGDVPLTVFQSIQIDGIIIVTSPQELVGMIVEKAVKMANMMNVPIFGIVENMSYIECPTCKEKIYLYGESKIKPVLEKYHLPLLAQIPITQDLAQKSDKGTIELFEGDFMDACVSVIETVVIVR